jgi:hypothetical protein
MEPPALLPLRRKAYCRFLSPLKIHRLAKFEYTNLESDGKHANHYTTEEEVRSKSVSNYRQVDVYMWQVTWGRQPAHLTCLM